jgi:hypothetical protein
LFQSSHLTFTPSGITINMSKKVQITATFSTTSSKLDPLDGLKMFPSEAASNSTNINDLARQSAKPNMANDTSTDNAPPAPPPQADGSS